MVPSTHPVPSGVLYPGPLTLVPFAALFDQFPWIFQMSYLELVPLGGAKVNGEARHQLSQFYRRLDFKSDGRTTMTMALSG